MRQEQLEEWMNEADIEYERAIRIDNIAIPRDTYVALFMQQKMKLYKQNERREPEIVERE